MAPIRPGTGEAQSSSLTSRGRMSIPRMVPMAPSSAVRSPKAAVPSGSTLLPATVRGTGSAVWAFRAQEVA